MTAKTVEQVHKTTVHIGDWHHFAVCRTCFWEGQRSGEYNASRIDHSGNAQAHAALMHRRWVKANRWWRRRFAASPVTHEVRPRSGEKLVCCGVWPMDVSGRDSFTFEAHEATCKGLAP